MIRLNSLHALWIPVNFSWVWKRISKVEESGLTIIIIDCGWPFSRPRYAAREEVWGRVETRSVVGWSVLCSQKKEIPETQRGLRCILRSMSGENLAMKFFSGLKMNDDCCCLRLIQGSDLLFSNTSKKGRGDLNLTVLNMLPRCCEGSKSMLEFIWITVPLLQLRLSPLSRDETVPKLEILPQSLSPR